MDKIILKGIRFHGYHGVAEAERQLGQKYEIDLELTTNLSTAGKPMTSPTQLTTPKLSNW